MIVLEEQLHRQRGRASQLGLRRIVGSNVPRKGQFTRRHASPAGPPDAGVHNRLRTITNHLLALEQVELFYSCNNSEALDITLVVSVIAVIILLFKRPPAWSARPLTNQWTRLKNIKTADSGRDPRGYGRGALPIKQPVAGYRMI